MTAAWPEREEQLRNADLEKRMALVFEAVGVIREMRNRNTHPPQGGALGRDLREGRGDRGALKAGAEIIRDQANLDELSIGVNVAKPKFSATGASTAFTVYVPLEGKIDGSAEIARTKKELEKTREQIAQAEKQLSNEEFRKRKPEHGQ
jgi:valyl-tRNA synthetase